MEKLYEELTPENRDILMLVAQGILLGQQESKKQDER